MRSADMVMRLAAFTACVGMGSCKEQLGPSGNFLACDADGQCASGFRCAQTELGAVCLNDEQWQERCDGRETCNGLDDDCNGTIDEGLTDVVTGMDVGECAVRIERCTDGALVAVEDGILPTDETCNGLDDDCDDVIDNDVPPQLSGFAVGECERSVAECDDGAYVVIDVGVEPTDETCDGLDNDCDEDADEDFMGSDDPDDELLVLDEPCVVGVGACAVAGVGVCDADRLGVACDAVAGNPSTELCDGFDNDCDEAIDETFVERGEDCSVGVGACRAEGVRVCRDDGFGTRCDADVGIPTDETCDGLDQDCDGEIDEGLGDGCCIPGTTRSCGTDFGACAVGTQTCSPERAWGACSGQSPVADTCNGLDDDCDGEADEGIAGCCGTPGGTNPCSVTRGACVAGVQTCGADGAWSSCSGVLPSVDRCDGFDNDCDDAADEDFADLTEPCSIGSGACAATGEKVCAVDGLGTTCGATEGTPLEETCNAIDDDCDSEVDDGLVIVTGTDIGECVEGIERCVDGEWAVVQERFDASIESCNGLDDDCDGIPDDEAPSCCTPGTVRTCGIDAGECTIGSQACSDDFAWSACTGVAPTAERCDGLDEDCDGTADDLWALLLGDACTVGLGACVRAGTWVCNPDFSPSMEGEREGVVCDAAPGVPGTESCNSIDDDCDGQVDETADVPPILDGSDIGRCEPRVIACVSGEMVEVYAGVGPTPEACNGLDDDCSAAVDDGIASLDCYGGPASTQGVGVCVGGSTACVDGNTQCLGQVLPNDERCDDFDEDCDGVVDGSTDAFAGDPVALEQPCYTGPEGTANVGECIMGTTTCSGGVWGGCADEELPVAEVCGDAADSDCDGRPDGITFLEDFEDNCAIPEATVTSDVPLECVETPADSEDPSRTPDGRRSLRVALLSDGAGAQIDWMFASCNPTGSGVLVVHLATATGLVQLGFNPLLEGEQSHFVYRPNGIDDVAVTRNDGGTTYDAVTVVIDATEWHEIGWSLSVAGEIVYTIDGEAFYTNSIDAAVFGMRFFARLFSAGDIQLSVDDVRFSSP